MKNGLFAISIAVLTSSAACDEGRRVVAVFADQGERVAVYEHSWASTELCVSYEACPVSSSSQDAELYIGHLEGDEVVLDEALEVPAGFVYWAYGTLAFVDSRGYVMVLDADGELFRFHHLDGRVVTVPADEFTERGFPSLDGRVVALVMDTAEGQQVRFVDPQTGEVLRTVVVPVDGVVGSGVAFGRAVHVWTPEGFGVWGLEWTPEARAGRADPELAAWVVPLQGEPRALEALPCAAATPSMALLGAWALPDGEALEGPVTRRPSAAPACSLSPGSPAPL